MKNFKILFLILFLITTMWQAPGCGSDSVFLITPAGPTIVLKGSTLQFETLPPGLVVTWSVLGGAGNGTIDQNGLYSAPNTLPVDPQITVMAEQDGASATALVDLRTGDVLSFGEPEMINDTPLPPITGIVEIIGAGISNRIAARTGSLEVSSTWTFSDGMNTEVFFNQAFDLNPFGDERNLTNDATNDQVPTSLFIDDVLNPGLLFIDEISGNNQLNFLASSDQGASFNAVVPVASNDKFQSQGNMKLDANGTIHVVYNEGTLADPFMDGQIMYSQSRDNGASWDPPVLVKPSAGAQCFPNLAVSSDGNTIHICYREDCSVIATDIFSATSTDGGVSFSIDEQVTNSGMVSLCKVARQDGQVLISYGEDSHAVLARSSDNGDTFPDKINMDMVATNITQPMPFISVDSLGRIDAIWFADPDNSGEPDSLRYSRSTDGGASFSSDVEIVNPLGGQNFLVMGLTHDISGRAHVQYATDVNDPGNNYDIFYLLGE